MKPFPGHIFLLLALVAMLSSCEVEFSPNADYKETPVVYCVLNQDEDTTWVRVERCYLTEGDIYSPGVVSDSINYPANSLNVMLVAKRDGVQVGDTMRFAYTERDHVEGNFASAAQPLYFLPSRGLLLDDCTYELWISKRATGEVIASATTSLVSRFCDYFHDYDNYSTTVIQKPSNSFKFVGENCDITWTPLHNARYYQPVVRFYYGVGGDTLSIDVPCPTLTSSPNISQVSSVGCHLSRSSFLFYLEQHLDKTPKSYLRLVDIVLTACNEDLYAYLYMTSNGSSQSQQTYTNIKGGLGVFGARRTNFVKTMQSDDNLKPNVGLKWWLLHGIDCGFM